MTFYTTQSLVNPISTVQGDELCPQNNTGTTNFPPFLRHCLLKLGPIRKFPSCKTLMIIFSLFEPAKKETP